MVPGFLAWQLIQPPASKDDCDSMLYSNQPRQHQPPKDDCSIAMYSNQPLMQPAPSSTCSTCSCHSNSKCSTHRCRNSKCSHRCHMQLWRRPLRHRWHRGGGHWQACTAQTAACRSISLLACSLLACSLETAQMCANGCKQALQPLNSPSSSRYALHEAAPMLHCCDGDMPTVTTPHDPRKLGANRSCQMATAKIKCLFCKSNLAKYTKSEFTYFKCEQQVDGGMGEAEIGEGRKEQLMQPRLDPN